MKPKSILIPFAAGLLLAATNTGWALGPFTHSVRGVVEAIDCPSQTITLKSKNGAKPLSFVWNDGTRFSHKGGCAKCSLDSGRDVRVSYRRELGKNVLREVSTKGTSAGCGAACK